MTAILLMIVVLAVVNVEGNPSCSRKLDLLVVIDGSESICGAESCPDWRHTLEFVKNIVSNFNVGPDGTRVALVTMSNQGNLEWNYDKYTDEESLLTAIDNVVYPRGEMDSVFDITGMVANLIKAAASQRPDATMIGICITDGAPSLHNELTITAASALHALGLNVFMVCVTDRCPEFIAKGVSSPPRQNNETYFMVKDYSSLHSIKENLVQQICSRKSTEKGVLGAVIGGISRIVNLFKGDMFSLA